MSQFFWGIQTFPPNRNMKSLCQLDISCFCFTIELTSPKPSGKNKNMIPSTPPNFNELISTNNGPCMEIVSPSTNSFFGHPVVLSQGRFLHIILLLFWLVAIDFEQPEFSFQTLRGLRFLGKLPPVGSHDGKKQPTQTTNPKNHRTLLWRGLDVYSRGLGSPNHQF